MTTTLSRGQLKAMRELANGAKIHEGIGVQRKRVRLQYEGRRRCALVCSLQALQDQGIIEKEAVRPGGVTVWGLSDLGRQLVQGS